jgi:hypothetical protein
MDIFETEIYRALHGVQGAIYMDCILGLLGVQI